MHVVVVRFQIQKYNNQTLQDQGKLVIPRVEPAVGGRLPGPGGPEGPQFGQPRIPGLVTQLPHRRQASTLTVMW